MHAHGELITGWLKEDHGFDGFVISDYQGIHQIPPLADDSPTTNQIVTSVNAGVDMFMEPIQFERFHTRLVAAVQDGAVSQERIDDAVARILTAKFELGLFEEPFADRTHADTIGSPEHRAIARKAVAASQVLLKNSGRALPLDDRDSIYVAGRNADDLGNQSGGWTGTWQGFSGEVTEGTTILEGIEAVADDVTYSVDASAPTDGADVGVVVVGETPYAEGFGDVGGPEWAWDPADGGVPREEKSMALQPGDVDVIEKVCAEIDTCVVLVVSGRPQVVTQQLGQIDALVASWLPGTEGAGVADVLFGERRFTGRLPVSWPRSADDPVVNVGDRGYDPLFPFGWGLSTGGRWSAVDRHRLELQDEALDPARGVAPAAARQIASQEVTRLEAEVTPSGAQRLLHVVNDVPHVLQAHREPHGGLRDADGGAAGCAELAVGRGRGVCDQGLRVAEVVRDVDHPQRVEERERALLRVLGGGALRYGEVERHDGATAAHLRARQVRLRVGVQERVAHGTHARQPLERLRHGERSRALRRDPHRQRLQALEQGPRVER
nr:hypothetical protein GCM10025730_29350 [Promicromonospora thailandica]